MTQTGHLVYVQDEPMILLADGSLERVGGEISTGGAQKGGHGEAGEHWATVGGHAVKVGAGKLAWSGGGGVNVATAPHGSYVAHSTEGGAVRLMHHPASGKEAEQVGSSSGSLHTDLDSAKEAAESHNKSKAVASSKNAPSEPSHFDQALRDNDVELDKHYAALKAAGTPQAKITNDKKVVRLNAKSEFLMAARNLHQASHNEIATYGGIPHYQSYLDDVK